MFQNSARGTLYIDDFESFEYREKKYLYLEFQFEDNTLRNKKIDDTNYRTEEWLERVVILGPPNGIKSATLKSKSKECKNYMSIKILKKISRSR